MLRTIFTIAALSACQIAGAQTSNLVQSSVNKAIAQRQAVQDPSAYVRNYQAPTIVEPTIPSYQHRVMAEFRSIMGAAEPVRSDNWKDAMPSGLNDRQRAVVETMTNPALAGAFATPVIPSYAVGSRNLYQNGTNQYTYKAGNQEFTVLGDSWDSVKQQVYSNNRSSEDYVKKATDLLEQNRASRDALQATELSDWTQSNHLGDRKAKYFDSITENIKQVEALWGPGLEVPTNGYSRQVDYLPLDGLMYAEHNVNGKTVRVYHVRGKNYIRTNVGTLELSIYAPIEASLSRYDEQFTVLPK